MYHNLQHLFDESNYFSGFYSGNFINEDLDVCSSDTLKFLNTLQSTNIVDMVQYYGIKIMDLVELINKFTLNKNPPNYELITYCNNLTIGEYKKYSKHLSNEIKLFLSLKFNFNKVIKTHHINYNKLLSVADFNGIIIQFANKCIDINTFLPMVFICVNLKSRISNQLVNFRNYHDTEINFLLDIFYDDVINNAKYSDETKINYIKCCVDELNRYYVGNKTETNFEINNFAEIYKITLPSILTKIRKLNDKSSKYESTAEFCEEMIGSVVATGLENIDYDITIDILYIFKSYTNASYSSQMKYYQRRCKYISQMIVDVVMNNYVNNVEFLESVFKETIKLNDINLRDEINDKINDLIWIDIESNKHEKYNVNMKCVLQHDDHLKIDNNYDDFPKKSSKKQKPIKITDIVEKCQEYEKKEVDKLICIDKYNDESDNNESDDNESDSESDSESDDNESNDNESSESDNNKSDNNKNDDTRRKICLDDNYVVEILSLIIKYTHNQYFNIKYTCKNKDLESYLNNFQECDLVNVLNIYNHCKELENIDYNMEIYNNLITFDNQHIYILTQMIKDAKYNYIKDELRNKLYNIQCVNILEHNITNYFHWTDIRKDSNNKYTVYFRDSSTLIEEIFSNDYKKYFIEKCLLDGIFTKQQEKSLTKLDELKRSIKYKKINNKKYHNITDDIYYEL